MKFLTFLLIVASVCSFALARGGGGGGHGSGERFRPNSNFFTRLNSSLQILLSAVTTSPNPANNVQYLWDLINPVARFVLLNQTAISSLPFNISQNLASNNKSLNWNQLPANVQSALLAQPLSGLLNLTYEQWGWVNPSSTFASTTLFSLVPATVQSTLPNIYILLAPLAYNTQIDLTALNATLIANAASNSFGRYPSGDLVKRFTREFFESFGSLLPPADGRRHKRHNNRPPFNYQPTAQSTFGDAVKRAEKYVRSVGVQCQ